MQEWFYITFPLSDPVQIFLLTLLIVLVAPLFFKKLKIPGIIGLILAGILVGPHGLNLLANDVNYKVFGSVGLIYLMFLLGLEMDLGGMKKQIMQTATFGILTFAIPFASGFFVFRHFFDYSFLSALLIGCAFATHTLLSYPIVRRLGIHKNAVVNITIGATIIADTAVLMVLTFLADLAGKTKSPGIYGISAALVLLIFLTLWGIPKISRWFFKANKGDSQSQFLFVLTIVFLSSFTTQLFAIEPIIGAFLAGLALNRVIPAASVLMRRLAFFGNALFIPFFLISIGMIIDPGIIFGSMATLQMGMILLTVGLFSKFLAAWITQKSFRMSGIQRNLMFGLSSSRAAAILAVLLVGYRVELINDIVLNGTLFYILGSCLVSSYVTELSGKKLAITEPIPKEPYRKIPERILVPVANPEAISSLTNLAFSIKDPGSTDPVYFLAIGTEESMLSEQTQKNFKMVFHTAEKLGFEHDMVHPVSRVDLNISQAILQSADELMASKIIMGWSENTGTDFLFGQLRDSIVSATERMVLITRKIRYLHLKGKIFVFYPPFAEFESGFDDSLLTVYHLALNTHRPLLFAGAPNAIHKTESFLSEINPSVEHRSVSFPGYPRYDQIIRMLETNDLLILLTASPGCISSHPVIDNLYKKFFRELPSNDIVLLYQARKEIDPLVLVSQLETIGIGSSMVPPIRGFNKILKKIINFIAEKKRRRT
ncbi:MAG: cation:proton antiporter [Bacteroidales bacterium]